MYRLFLCLTVQLCLLTSVSFADRYVDINNSAPAAPYTNWTTAATNIQTAVDSALSGETVWVTNGHYRLVSAITITNSINVKSVNGPEVTTVDGQWSTRCFFCGDGSLPSSPPRVSTNMIAGFKVINGFDFYNGGGVARGSDAVVAVSNCVISENLSLACGGGIAGCAVYDCIISDNTAWGFGGGVFDANEVLNSILSGNVSEDGAGGGASEVQSIRGCRVSGNGAMSGGGLANCESIKNCLITDNYATGQWADGGVGGVRYGTLENCTVCNNVTFGSGFGGFSGEQNNLGSARNSIIYYNYPSNLGYADLMFSCSSDTTNNYHGNTTNAPLFADAGHGDYRLAGNSPCVDAGINFYVSESSDLDRAPRIFNERVDLGSYEYHYGLADSDGDGLGDAAESRYGTDPNKKDTDGDGFDDNWEILHGESPTRPNLDVRAYIESNHAVFGYYTPASIGDLAMGKMMIAASNSAVRVQMQLLQSDDLVTWTNAGASVEWTIPTKDKAFFRLRAEP